MLAENNPIIDEAASTIYSISQDNILLEQIRARDEAIAHENYVRRQMEEQAKQLDQKNKQINVLSKQRQEDSLLIESLRKEIEELRRNQK